MDDPPQCYRHYQRGLIIDIEISIDKILKSDRNSRAVIKIACLQYKYNRYYDLVIKTKLINDQEASHAR